MSALLAGAAPRIEGLAPTGRGIARPEDVVVSLDGTVWASDRASAAARIRPDGTLFRCGAAGGEPNGLKIDPRDGSVVIANLDLGILQRLSPETGAISTILGAAGGTPIKTPNYVIFDSRGNLWCSVSTRRGRVPDWLDGTPDGFIFCMAPSGEARIAADGLKFPNGLALDRDERWLYCAQTAAENVLRFRVSGQDLSGGELYGPERLGTRAFPDGIAFDSAGNLLVTLVLANRIVSIAPDGAVTPVAEDDGSGLIVKPTNIAFGGADLRDVYVGSIAANYVLRGRSSIAGQPLVHQRERRRNSWHGSP
jgi:gluconolactonase